MRLYLSADSKHKIGYTPDWVKVSYTDKGIDYELTLDIRGEIDYDNECLNCRCKGNLDPWVLYNYTTGEETDLYELSEEEVDTLLPIKKIIEIIQRGTDFVVGIYPEIHSENNPLIESDVLSNCSGTFELYDGTNEYTIRFKFETELNL